MFIVGSDDDDDDYDDDDSGHMVSTNTPPNSAELQVRSTVILFRLAWRHNHKYVEP